MFLQNWFSITVREARKHFQELSSFRNREFLKAAKDEFVEALDKVKNNQVENQTKKLNSSSSESFWTDFKDTFYKGKESNFIGTLNYHSQDVMDDAEKALLFKENT